MNRDELIEKARACPGMAYWHDDELAVVADFCLPLLAEARREAFEEAAHQIRALAARVAELEAKDMRFSQREPTAMRARIAALEAERDALRADKDRMDYLDQEWYREECWRDAGMPSGAPFSLFRQNLPITRESIDAARACWAKATP